MEAKFNAERDENSITADTQFFYAWGLVRSKYQDDKILGIKLLKGTHAGLSPPPHLHT